MRFTRYCKGHRCTKFTGKHFVTVNRCFFLSREINLRYIQTDGACTSANRNDDRFFGRNVNRQAAPPNRGHSSCWLVESLAQYFSHVPLFSDIQYVCHTVWVLYGRLTFMNTSITVCDSRNITKSAQDSHCNKNIPVVNYGDCT